MKWASIDIGTNTVLMTIAEMGSTIEDALDVATVTRLGEGLEATGSLGRTAMDRTLAVLGRYRDVLRQEGADDVLCVGTAALREAGNGPAFAAEIESRLGFPVRVLTAEQEAYYTYLSVARDPLCLFAAEFFVIDIGGGSTEVMKGSRGGLEASVSLPFGSVKLTEMFISHDPPIPSELEALQRFLESSVSLPFRSLQLPVFGTAGTVTTLGALASGLKDFNSKTLHGLPVEAEDVEGWIRRLSTLALKDRLLIPGMAPGRADVILQGLMLLKEILSGMGVRRLTVSTKGVRFGLIYELARNQSEKGLP